MKKIVIASMWAVCALPGVAAAAEESSAAVFACETPAIPSISTSTEGLRRVEKRIQLWAKCANDYLAKDNSEAAHASVGQVAQEISEQRLKWLKNTVGFSNGQAASEMTNSLSMLAQSPFQPSRYAPVQQGNYLRVAKPAESGGEGQPAATVK
jgi:hypothetical protein